MGKKAKIDKYIYIYIIYTTIYVSAKKGTNTFWNMDKYETIILNEIIQIQKIIYYKIYWYEMSRRI